MIEKKKTKPARGTRRKNVLLPVDFSPISQSAFETALDFIGCRDQIILMHVIPYSFAKRNILRESLKAARKKLSAFVRGDGVCPPGRNCFKLLVRVGTPFQEILAAAKDHNASLIVLGIDESSPFGGLALGHTADRVSRYAWCSVLLVRSGTNHPNRTRSLWVGESAPRARLAP